MTNRLPVSLALVACLASPAVALAQPAPAASAAPPSQPLAAAGADTPRPAFAAPRAEGFWAPFTAVPGDFANFLSMDTARLVGLTGAAALVTARWDGQALDEAQERFPLRRFEAGNIGGGFLAQMGAAFALYGAGKMAGGGELAELGSDLLRAQMLSQGIVQAGKLMANRQRPDASNNASFPSGHTASAFATASVLQSHYGWKAGVPAYAFGAYVAAARMSANKHNLSDVLVGAAIGMASGRTVTVGRGRARFGMGVAPTVGGAAVVFAKK